VKWERKAARRRLRRLVTERSSVIVELDDAEERRLVREVLAEDPSTPAADDQIDVLDAVVWLTGWLDAAEVARLSLDRPVIVVGSVARGLWEVLHEAAAAFRFSLYRFTVAGCRAVIDAAVGTAVVLRPPQAPRPSYVRRIVFSEAGRRPSARPTYVGEVDLPADPAPRPISIPPDPYAGRQRPYSPPLPDIDLETCIKV
jgi:hypothetical protein